MNATNKKIQDFPKNLPLIREDKLSIYPFIIVPLIISNKYDIDAVNYAKKYNTLVFIATVKNSKESIDNDNNLYDIGVVGNIIRVTKLKNGNIKILFQGLEKGIKLSKLVNKESSIYKFKMSQINILKHKESDEIKIKPLLKILYEKLEDLGKVSNKFPKELLQAVIDTKDVYRISYLVSSILKFDKNLTSTILKESSIEKNLTFLIEYILELIESTIIEDEIRSKVYKNIEKNNREFVLKEQLKEITRELGIVQHSEEDFNEDNKYIDKLNKIEKFLTPTVYKEIDKQIHRFSKMQPESSDANVLENYLDLVFDIPFGKYSKKHMNIDKIESQLDKEHFSLIKPKERIVEFFAVKELSNLRGINLNHKNSSMILCFAGPPGVGKTSLANSIATALDRPLVRIALGGLEDISELRGHRRTYVAAMAGRIIQGLVNSKTMDPVIVLDEVDKIGKSHHGNIGSVLLELLDSEQNKEYRDYYVNFDIDLSKVIFIATANNIGAISSPLRDRMEFIALNSYTPLEKFKITKQFLIPQELKKHALKKYEFNITDNALKILIDEYTRESGVRKLRQQLSSLMRKSALMLLKDSKLKKINISIKNLETFLDKKVFQWTLIDNKSSIGIVNGLAWTSVGGDMLQIEAIKLKGKGLIQLTGTLGDVMKESAQISFSVIKLLIDNKYIKIKNAKKDIEFYKEFNIHLHIPEGATPKDGPSAGITMAVAIASILSDRKVDNKIAMTGELTLIGRVLPIGGLKEKLIAAYKAGITKVLIPRKNYELDLKDIPQEVLDNIEIHPVDRIEEVLEYSLI